jgi:hypothetical protein
LPEPVPTKPGEVELDRQRLKPLVAHLICMGSPGRVKNCAWPSHLGLAAIELLAVPAQCVEPDVRPVMPMFVDFLRLRVNDAQNPDSGMALDFDLQTLELGAGHVRNVQYKSGHDATFVAPLSKGEERMRVGARLLLVELLLACSACGAAPNAQSTLAAARRAMGAYDAGATTQAVGHVEAEGRTGDFRETVRNRDGAYVTSMRYKMFGEADGFDGRIHWKQDRSAASHVLNAPFTVAATVTTAWLKRRGYFQPGSAKIEAVAREKIGGRPMTVLTMRPKDGDAARLAFDDNSHLLVRVQRDRLLSTATETYSDYRRIGGRALPFRIDIDDSGDRTVIRVDRYALVANSSFARPRPPADTVIAGSATIPMLAPNFAVVPARINGRQYDFILDTGGHNIVTPEIAAELGLRSEGRGTSGGSGPKRAPTSDTRVAKLELGSATMTGQHFTILDLGDAVKRKDKPPLAGILGLEIFERMVVTVDEPHGRLTIDPPQPARRCEGDMIPLLFDDDMPAVRGSIDGIPAQIGIDVGNGGLPIVLWRWAQAHKLDARLRSGKQGSGSGVGGRNTTYRTPHHDIVIGRTKIHDTDVNYSTTPTGYFSSRADSMNLGRTLLQKYVVRFDYPQGHMCVIRPAR